MSVDSTSSTVYRKKNLKSTLSQSDNYPYSRHSLKHYKQKSLINSEIMSGVEENSTDILTDLSSLPYIPCKQEDKRNRRFSELKPSLTQGTNSDRRNSIPQLSFSSLLPNAFRSNKHQHKSTTKDELNTSIDTANNSFSLSFNDTMAMRAEPLSSSKVFNSSNHGSRTNLSISNDTLSSISHEDSLSSLFILDPAYTEPKSTDSFVLGLNTSLCVAEIYHKHFFQYFHTNYCGEFQQEGPFIASLRLFYNNSNCIARSIIRVRSRNYDVSVPVDGTNDDNILQVLFNQAHLSAIQSYKPASDPKANEKIYLFDKSNDERQNCKIGFIYQRTDQKDEMDIFNNDYYSNDMVDFLQILGDRVRLKGFEKYRGDLDVKNDLHGDYSYYTQYNNHEIMFNIAPMIPSSNTNGQCVKRKGLVGNSFVCVVFQEPDAEFIPDFISGKVTQIYITVQPLTLNQRVYYKIGIWHRHDLHSLIDPPGGIYECDKSFRDYFLTLLLNSIHVAIESPKLRHCITEQRQRLKEEDLKKLSQILCTGPIFDTRPDVENHNNHIDQRPSSRTETIGSSGIENGVQNSGRVSPAPTKKRTFSKIFGVFSSRSGSVSIPTNDISPVTPSLPSPEVNNVPIRTAQSSSKENVKRAASVKHRAAPSPPVPPRVPVSYMRSLAPTHSATLPLASSHSSVSNSFNSTNDNSPSQDNSLNSSTFEEPIRNRSNSSPGDNANMTTKRPLSTVSNASKEISDTGSSIDDYSESDFSEDERFEHRPTITESSVILPTNTNS